MLSGTAVWSLGVANGLVGVPTTVPVSPCPGCTIGVDGISVLANTFALSIPMERAFLGVPLAVHGFEFRGIGPCLSVCTSATRSAAAGSDRGPTLRRGLLSLRT
ncbi:MAG: hypothetical protein IPK26_26595 [Planctomycetes bacterium]|nr:hypothetical protein [Planctomycetota bacterium]